MLSNPYKTKTIVSWLRAHIPARNFNVFGLIFSIFQVYLYFWVLPSFAKRHWPAEFLETVPKRLFLFALTVVGHTSWAVTLNLIMCGIYKLNHPFFEQYKNTTQPWPWDVNPEEWRKLLYRTLKVLAHHHFVIFPIDMFLKFVLLAKEPYHMDLESFPSGFTIFKHICFCILMEDFLTYWAHRLLHRPWFYIRYHKIHHEYNAPVMLASEYCHSVEYVLANLVPAAGGLLFLQGRLHLITHVMWMVLRMAKSGDAHCGYDFPWSPFQYIPFGTDEVFHDFHHTNNIGNYASFFTIWDTIMGTTQKLPEKYQPLGSPLRKIKKSKKVKSPKDLKDE